MLYAVGIFSYFIASIASLLVDLDAQQASEEQIAQEKDGVWLSRGELDALRSILDREEKALAAQAGTRAGSTVTQPAEEGR